MCFIGGGINMEPVMLKHLVARYRMDKILLEKYPEKKMLLEKRMKQHEKDIFIIIRIPLSIHWILL